MTKDTIDPIKTNTPFDDEKAFSFYEGFIEPTYQCAEDLKTLIKRSLDQANAEIVKETGQQKLIAELLNNTRLSLSIVAYFEHMKHMYQSLQTPLCYKYGTYILFKLALSSFDQEYSMDASFDGIKNIDGDYIYDTDSNFSFNGGGSSFNLHIPDYDENTFDKYLDYQTLPNITANYANEPIPIDLNNGEEIYDYRNSKMGIFDLNIGDLTPLYQHLKSQLGKHTRQRLDGYDDEYKVNSLCSMMDKNTVLLNVAKGKKIILTELLKKLSHPNLNLLTIYRNIYLSIRKNYACNPIEFIKKNHYSPEPFFASGQRILKILIVKTLEESDFIGIDMILRDLCFLYKFKCYK